jgi:D-serine deaminase-like pyridoxal phosphate-dependent protein
MNRTGISQERTDEILHLARELEGQFRGLHYYDGHAAGFPPADREARTHAGYDRLLEIVRALDSPAGEIITSGTPAAPFAASYAGFQNGAFIHRISPGTVVYNDTTSLEQLPGFGYTPAALVLSTVISHPTPALITCDAGHKSVSSDAGVPTCAVLARADLNPQKPSEEHLPIEGASLPAIGEKLYLIPRHVCPTVNNFDRALIVEKGKIVASEPVTARGHE